MFNAYCEFERQKELRAGQSTACYLGRMVLMFGNTRGLALYFGCHDGKNNGYCKLLKMLQMLFWVSSLRILQERVLMLQRLFGFAIYNNMKLFSQNTGNLFVGNPAACYSENLPTMTYEKQSFDTFGCGWRQAVIRGSTSYKIATSVEFSLSAENTVSLIDFYRKIGPH